MRYAIVSDIHANLQAWEAVVADMGNLQIDHIICLGDIVGYGPDPSQLANAIRKLSGVTVIGNHDAAACGRMDASVFNDNAREAIEWTTRQMSEAELQYLNELPELARPEGAGFLAVHAEVVEPLAFGYILDEETAKANFAACDDPIIFIGHSHKAGVFMQTPSGGISIHEPNDFYCDPQNRYIINPGSVGDPRSTSIVASYAIYDDETRDVHFRRIDFDIESFRSSIDATELQARPFFLRYLDELSAHHGTSECTIPSVEETDSVPQFNLSVAPIEIKRKDPFAKIGVWVLLVALAVGIWFFATNTKPSDEIVDDTRAAKKERSAESASQTKELKKKKLPVVTDKLPVKARYIRISLPRVGFLCLAEVEVYSGDVNVALKGKATQSSDFDDFSTAERAIDGAMSGKYSERSMTHTLKSDSNWWLLDLGKSYTIDQVILWNRDEGAENANREMLRARLDGFTLEMLDAENNPVYLKKGNPGKNVRNVVR